MKRILLFTFILLASKGVFAQTSKDTIIIIVESKPTVDEIDRGVFRSTNSNTDYEHTPICYTFVNSYQDVYEELEQIDIQKWTRNYVNKTFRVIISEAVPTAQFVDEWLTNLSREKGNKLYIMDINTIPDSEERYECYQVKKAYEY